jgi:hypothetical protein
MIGAQPWRQRVLAPRFLAKYEDIPNAAEPVCPRPRLFRVTVNKRLKCRLGALRIARLKNYVSGRLWPDSGAEHDPEKCEAVFGKDHAQTKG